MAVSSQSLERRCGDVGFMSDGIGMLGASLPLMGAAIVGDYVSFSNPRAVTSVTSVLGGATVYSENRDTEWFQTSMTHRSLGL